MNKGKKLYEGKAKIIYFLYSYEILSFQTSVENYINSFGMITKIK